MELRFRNALLATMPVVALLILTPAADAQTPTSIGTASEAALTGLWLTTDFPDFTGHPGTASEIPISLVQRGLPPQRVGLSVNGIPDGWQWEITGGGKAVSAAMVGTDATTNLTLKVTPPAGADKTTYRFTVVGKTEGAPVELPIALTLTAAEPAQLTLRPKLPALRGTPNSNFDFQVEVRNEGGEDTVVNLLSQAPNGFQVTFKEQYGSQELTSLPLKADESRTVSVSVRPPNAIAAGQYPVAIRAANDRISADAGLMLDVTGRPSLAIEGPEGRLSGSATAGEERSFTFTLTNSGSAPARNVRLSSTAPQGWKVAFEPETIPEIGAGDRPEVAVRITPSDKAIAGDYVVRVNAAGDTVSDNVSFRVTVSTSTWWGLIGLLVIAAAVVVLATAVTRYGRR